jgi:hypothetical protein
MLYVVLPMCKKLSKEHKAVIMDTIESNIEKLETHLDDIIGTKHIEVVRCRTAKTGKTAKK